MLSITFEMIIPTNEGILYCSYFCMKMALRVIMIMASRDGVVHTILLESEDFDYNGLLIKPGFL